MKIVDLYNLDNLYHIVSYRTDLPIRTTYKMLKLFEAVRKDAEFYREKLVEILNKYALRDEEGKTVLSEDGQNVKIKPECINECEQEIQDLANLEVEKPNISISLDEVPAGLSVQEFNLLMPFIEE